MTETANMSEALSPEYFILKTLTDGVDITPSYVATLGAQITDAISMSMLMGPSGTFGVSLSDLTRFSELLQAAEGATLAETIQITDVAAALRGAIVLEQLNLLETYGAAALYGITVAEALEAQDTLARFLGGAVSDSVTVTPITSAAKLLTPVETDSVTISETAAPAFLMSATMVEGVDITAADAIQMIFGPTVTEDIEIGAAFISPGNSVTTWALNPRAGAVTEYTNYDFNSFAKNGRSYLGAADDGLYRLDGDTDDGTDIIAELQSGMLQMAGSRFSSFKAIYVGMRGAGDFVLKLDAGDGRTYTYNFTSKDMETTRVRLGKGLRARYFSFTLTSTGSDFDLQDIEFVPILARRRV